MATAVTAVIASARRQIFDHFMSADAISADSAIAFTPRRLIAERQFERLQDAGVICSTEDGRYWMDVPVYRKWEKGLRVRLALVILLAIAIACGGAWVAANGLAL